MKIRFDYMPPLHLGYCDAGDYEWHVTAMVSYYRRDAGEPIVSESYRMFWPANPWHELELAEKNHVKAS